MFLVNKFLLAVGLLCLAGTAFSAEMKADAPELPEADVPLLTEAEVKQVDALEVRSLDGDEKMESIVSDAIDVSTVRGKFIPTWYHDTCRPEWRIRQMVRLRNGCYAYIPAVFCRGSCPSTSIGYTQTWSGYGTQRIYTNCKCCKPIKTRRRFRFTCPGYVRYYNIYYFSACSCQPCPTRYESYSITPAPFFPIDTDIGQVEVGPVKVGPVGRQ